MESRETIAAIATGMGNAGIGIVRISGENAFAVADAVFRGKNKKKLSSNSADFLILAWSETVGNREMEGPDIIPATIYPTMTGCPSHLKMTVMIPAIVKIVARSDIKGATSDIGVTFYMVNSLRTRIRFLSMGLSFLIAWSKGT